MNVQGLSALTVMLVGYGGFSCVGTPPTTREMVVSAAISLKGPMEDLAAAFQERNRYVRRGHRLVYGHHPVH